MLYQLIYFIACLVDLKSFDFQQSSALRMCWINTKNVSSFYHAFTSSDTAYARGVNTMELMMETCTATNWQNFDTGNNGLSTAASDLTAYVASLPRGRILMAVTSDEPQASFE